jgi:hypothetical protein
LSANTSNEELANPVVRELSLMIKKSRLSKICFVVLLRELTLTKESFWMKSRTHLEKDWYLDRSTGF